MWRVVYAQRATLKEIDTHYTLYDLLDLNDVLDAMSEAERDASKR